MFAESYTVEYGEPKCGSSSSAPTRWDAIAPLTLEDCSLPDLLEGNLVIMIVSRKDGTILAVTHISLSRYLSLEEDKESMFSSFTFERWCDE